MMALQPPFEPMAFFLDIEGGRKMQKQKQEFEAIPNYPSAPRRDFFIGATDIARLVEHYAC